MLNVVFDELTVAMLTKQDLNTRGPVSEKVVCLGNTLDIGPIFDMDRLSERINYFQRIMGNAGIDYRHIDWQKIVDDYNTIKNVLAEGGNIRVWHCDMAFSVCGLALLCYMAQNSKSEIFLLQCQRDIGNVTESYNPIFPHTHWAMMTAEKCQSLVGEGVRLSCQERKYYASLWEKFMFDNTNLRVIGGDDVISVDDSYYDKVIKEVLNETLGDDDERYVRVLEQTGEYINQIWFMDRMKGM